MKKKQSKCSRDEQSRPEILASSLVRIKEFGLIKRYSGLDYLFKLSKTKGNIPVAFIRIFPQGRRRVFFSYLDDFVDKNDVVVIMLLN